MTALFTTENGFNKAAIMADAWARTRNQGRKATVEARRAAFAFNLRAAWKSAHNLRDYAAAAIAREAEATERAAVIALIPAAERIARADRLDREAYRLDHADRNGSAMPRIRAMQIEAAQLRAA